MKKKNTTKTKLIATIVSMVSALCLLAVGVFATLTNFQVAIANQLNLEFSAVEGTLYATRMGDVAGTDRTTSKVLSESTTATDWLKVYDGTTTEGVQNDALTSIQEKVDFISNDKIKEKVNAGTTSIAITYYFYYTLPENAVANNVVLTAPAVSDSNVAITYAYVKTTSSTLPDFTSGTVLTNGETVQVAGGEHLFIKAEAKVNLSKSVKIENADWSFTLNFGISTFSVTENSLAFNAVSGADSYEVWAKVSSASGTGLLTQASVIGDTDSTLGTLVKVLDASTTSVDLDDVLYSFSSGRYIVSVVPKTASGEQISSATMSVGYDHTYAPIKVTDTAIDGNYYYYINLGEYPQTAVEDSVTLAALNALSDSAKTGKTFTIGASEDDVQTAHEEYAYKGEKYVKVTSAVVFGTGDQYMFSNGTKVTTGDTYWFKVEPIKWYLLEAYSTTKTEYTGSTSNIRVISEYALTANVIFGAEPETQATSLIQSNAPILGATPYPGVKTETYWDKSNMREWLSGMFYNSAFSNTDKERIKLSTTRFFGAGEYNTPDDYLVTTGGTTCEDSVWLLSKYEITNTYYKENYYLNKTNRSAMATDFAKVNYIHLNSDGSSRIYCLRTMGSHVVETTYWDTSNSSIYYYASSNIAGIRPSLTISL